MKSFMLQFSTTPAWQSGTIRLFTRSPFSHVDIVVPPGTPGLEGFVKDAYGLLGASDGGVMVRPPNYHEFLRRQRMTLQSDATDDLFAALATQIGKPFDDNALYRTMDMNWRARDWRDTGQWYCAELIAWGLEKANYFRGRRFPVYIDKMHVAPQNLIDLLAGDFDPKEFEQEA